MKPRRVWQAANGAVLPVFVDAEARIGIGRGRRAAARRRRVAAAHRASARSSDERPAVAHRLRRARLRRLRGGRHDLWFEEGEAGAQVTALRTLLGPEALDPERQRTRSPPPRGHRDLAEGTGRALAPTSASACARRSSFSSKRTARRSRKPRSWNVTPRDIYLAATRIVMRMVVVLFAEARNLLPRDNAIYHDSYGLQGLREALDRVGGDAGS